MSWYRDDPTSRYNKNYSYERRRERDEELDRRSNQRETRYDDRYSGRSSQPETSDSRSRDYGQREYSQGATRQNIQRDPDYFHRGQGYRQGDRVYNQGYRDYRKENYSSRERVSRREEFSRAGETSVRDRVYTPVARSSGQEGYLSGSRSQGNRQYSPSDKGFSPGDRAQSSVKRENTSLKREYSADRGQGHKGYSPGERFSPGDRTQTSTQRGHSLDRGQEHRQYDPGDTSGQGQRGYSPGETRRGDTSKERKKKMILDEIEKELMGSQVNETNHRKMKERQDGNVKEQESNIIYGRNDKNSDINKNIHPIVNEGDRVTIDYGHKSSDGANQPSYQGSLSFDDHLAQLALMNVFAQKRDNHLAEKEPKNRSLHNSNIEQCTTSSSSLPCTPTDSNPIFNNVISGVTEIHVDNKTINVSIGHVAGLEVIQPDPTRKEIISDPTIKDKLLRNVHGNIDDLLSKLQFKLCSEKEIAKTKTKTTTMQASKTESNKDVVNRSHVTIPGFEQWEDGDSENRNIGNNPDKSNIDVFSSDQDVDFRIGIPYTEKTETSEGNEFRCSNVETNKNTTDDTCEDADYRGIFTNPHAVTGDNITRPGYRDGTENIDLSNTQSKVINTQTKGKEGRLASMSEEELRLEFQRQWESKGSKKKEGGGSSFREGTDKKIHSPANRDVYKEQIMKEFQKRWDNEQMIKENVNDETGGTVLPTVPGEAQINSLPKVQYQNRNRQKSGPYQPDRFHRPEPQQRHRKQDFEPHQRHKMQRNEPNQFYRHHSGSLTNRDDVKSFNQINRQGTHGFRNNQGNYQQSFSKRQFQGNAKMKESEVKLHNQTDIKTVNTFKTDKRHQLLNTDDTKNKPDRDRKQTINVEEKLRPTDNQNNRKTFDGSGFTKHHFKKEPIEKVKEENTQKEKNSENKLHEKSSKKSIKEFRIPKLGKNQGKVQKQLTESEKDKKAVQKQSADREKDMKTIPDQPVDSNKDKKTLSKQPGENDTDKKALSKQLSDSNKDNKTTIKQFHDMKGTDSSERNSQTLPKNTPPREGPSNIFEKLSLEITPPKEKKQVEAKKHSEVEKKASTSIKMEPSSSSDRSDSGIFGKLEQFIGKTNSKSNQSSQKSSLPDMGHKKEKNETKKNTEMENKAHFSIRGMKEIDGRLYWKKIRILQPKIVLKKLTPKDIEKKSKVTKISKSSSSSGNKEKEKHAKSAHEKSSSGKMKKKTIRILSESDDSEDIPKKPKKMNDIIKLEDSDSDKSDSFNYSVDENSPVKQTKKAVKILLESDDSEDEENNKNLPSFSKNDKEENSPTKKTKKAIHVSSESEDSKRNLDDVKISKEKNVNLTGSDENQGLSTEFSKNSYEEKSPIKQTKKTLQISSESEHSDTNKKTQTVLVEDNSDTNHSDNSSKGPKNDSKELFEDKLSESECSESHEDIRDGEFMEIGSDDETQELGNWFEPIDVDTLEPFEDDIGSAIAECLGTESPTDELGETDSKSKVINNMYFCNDIALNDDKTMQNHRNQPGKKPENVKSKKLKDEAAVHKASDDVNCYNNKKKPICFVSVSLENDDEEEEEQSQSLFANEPRNNSASEKKSTTTESTRARTKYNDNSTKDCVEPNTSSQNNITADNEEKTNRANESEDDLPIIKRPKLKSRTRVTSRSFERETGEDERNLSTETKITPRKKKLFKHRKIVHPKQEESGHEGDIEDNENNPEEPTQRYEWDDENQENNNKKDIGMCDTSAGNYTNKTDEVDGVKIEVKDEPEWLKSGYTQEPDTVFISDDDDDDMIITSSQPVIILDSSDNDDIIESKKVKPAIKKELNVHDEAVHDPDYWDFSSPDNDSDRDSDFEADKFFKMVSRLSETTEVDSNEEMDDSMTEIGLDIFSGDEEVLQYETQNQSTESKAGNDCVTQVENKENNNRREDKSETSCTEYLSSGRPTVTEHTDGVPIIIEEVDDDEYLESSFSDDSSLSDFDEITAQATQHFSYVQGYVKSQGSKMKKEQNESQSFDSEKTLEYSEENQGDKIKSSTTDNKDSSDMTEEDSESEDDNKINKISSNSHHTKKVDAGDDQSETQVFDDSFIDNYTAETQIDPDNVESDEDQIELNDYKATTQAAVDTEINVYDMETQVDSQDPLDLYQAETQVISDSGENVDSDDSKEPQNTSEDDIESKFDDPQYELYLQMDGKKSTMNISGRLGIKIDHSFHENPDLHYSDDLIYLGENQNKEKNGLYLAETQPMITDETGTNSDNENDAYFEATQVDRNAISEPEESDADESNDPYLAQTQHCDTSVISINSDNESSAYIQQTQAINEIMSNTEEKGTDDPYLTETQHMETTETSYSNRDDEAYMAETQVDRETASPMDDNPDAYSDLTQPNDTIGNENDSDTGDKIYDISTQVDQSSENINKQRSEIIAKDSLKKSILSLKKGIIKSTDLIRKKRSFSPENSMHENNRATVKEKYNYDVEGSPQKKSRIDSGETGLTEGKAQEMPKVQETSLQKKDITRKSILIEPMASTSFYGSSATRVPPARTQSFLDATKDIVVTDASKDDTWLSKKSSKNMGKGKSGKRRRNKSSETAVNFKDQILKARQAYKERQLKVKTNPECVADPAKKLKHQTSRGSLDAEDDVETPTLSQAIGIGLPMLDPSIFYRPKPSKEPISTINAEVTTSSSTIVTSTVTMATSTSCTTVGTTVHVSIPSSSASTSVTCTTKYGGPSKIGDKSNSYKDKAAKHSDKSDEIRSNSDDKSKPKSNSVHSGKSDKHISDKHLSTKLKDTEKSGNKSPFDGKDMDISSGIDKKKYDGKSRQSSGDNHSKSDKHRSSDKHQLNHKHKTSDMHQSSDKHKHDPDKFHRDESSKKDKNKDEHRSHKHKHKSSHKHNKDGDRKHHKSKKHKSDKSDSIKTGHSIQFDKENKADSANNAAVTVNKATSSASGKEPVTTSGNKQLDKSSLNNNLEKVQVTNSSKNNESASVSISVAKDLVSSEHRNKEKCNSKQKDKNKSVEKNPSVGITDEQVPSTSKEKKVNNKRTDVLEKMAASTTSKGLQSCMSAKSADQKKKRTVTWGNNTFHGSQKQTNMQNKTHILSTSAQSLMDKITPGPPLPIPQTVTYPPDLMKLNDHLTWEKIIAVILKWNPCWFEERDKMESSGMKKCLPPPVAADISSSGLFQLVDKYISLEEYVNKFMLPLLMHETWQTLYTDWREKKTRGKLNKIHFLLNQVANHSDRLQEYLLIGVMTREERKHWTCLNEGDLLTLRMKGLERTPGKCESVNKYILAVVVSVSFKDSRKDVDRICQHEELGKFRKPDSIGVVLAVRVRKRLFTPHGITEIQPVSSLVSTKRQIDALAYFPKSPLCRDLLFPSSNTIYSDRAVHSLPHDRKKLNQSQSIAVNTVVKIASRVATGIPRICLLQGPPGTGKSFTIINIIRRIVQEKKGQCSICLTAPSHAAVDELLRKIHKLNLDTAEKTKVNLVRLGKKHSVHPDVQCYCLDSLVQRRLMDYVPQSLLAERNTLENKISAIKDNIKSTKDKFQTQKWTNDLRRLQKDKENLEAKFQIDRNQVNPGQEKRAKSEILNGAHVIAGTLSSMGSNLLKTYLSQSNLFDCVIVDEATQAIEVDTLIPLQYGVSKLVLVGDPEQLCPTVISQEAKDHKLNMSLFQRLDSHFRFSTGSPNPVIFLDTQYRMDREIAYFPNQYIYEGRLKSETPISKFNLVPYLLYDIREGEEQFSQGSRSMSNQMEAVFTAELCQLILQETKFVERSIGIIAPYAKQKDEILKQLAMRGMKQIEVSTVDGFQGREKHIVIMSCVRAVSGSLGFVGNRNRMNVALTRAKYAMYLVGHFGALESSDEWKALIADARQRHKIVSVTVDTYSQDIRHCLKNR